MKLYKISGVFFVGIFSFFLMTDTASAGWEDYTDPMWWPGTGFGADWTGTQWDAGSFEALLKADAGDNGGTLQGSELAGLRPTKVRVTHSDAPTYFSIRNVGGGEVFASDGSYVSGTELDLIYAPDGDIGRLYFGGSGITAIEFFFPDPSGESDDVNLSVSIEENMTLDCGSDVDIDGGGVLIPGAPEANATTCTVTTNDQDGYVLQLEDSNTGANTLVHDTLSESITDLTAWDASTPNAAAWIDATTEGLGFSVYDSTATKNDTWWGTGVSCHDANNLYAGIPDNGSAQDIMEHTSYAANSTTTSICYRVDVPMSQASGEYTGAVTYTATGRP